MQFSRVRYRPHRLRREELSNKTHRLARETKQAGVEGTLISRTVPGDERTLERDPPNPGRKNGPRASTMPPPFRTIHSDHPSSPS